MGEERERVEEKQGSGRGYVEIEVVRLSLIQCQLEERRSG
jgi:hypothetical protein